MTMVSDKVHMRVCLRCKKLLLLLLLLLLLYIYICNIAAVYTYDIHMIYI